MSIRVAPNGGSADYQHQTRYERQMREEARGFHEGSSSAAVELRVVDPGDGQLVVVMTAVLSPTNTRRDSCPLDSERLGTWLRLHLETHCRPPKRPVWGTPKTAAARGMSPRRRIPNPHHRRVQVMAENDIRPNESPAQGPVSAEERVSARMDELNPAVLDYHDWLALMEEHARQAVEAERERPLRFILEGRTDEPNPEPCKSCGGVGCRAYGSTATWRGGIGGQAITSDVCDRCWGSGVEGHPWASMRAWRTVQEKAARAEKAVRELAEAEARALLRDWRDRCLKAALKWGLDAPHLAEANAEIQAQIAKINAALGEAAEPGEAADAE